MRDNEKAKIAFEKASKGQEMITSYPIFLLIIQLFIELNFLLTGQKGYCTLDNLSPWDAAKHMESAAALAKELGHWHEVSDHYRRASELYNECGRSQPASDALGKGARYLDFLPR